MSDNEMTVQHELEDFVQVAIDEWMLENPEPCVEIAPKPAMPKSEFVSINNGFVVFDPKHNLVADMHISIAGSGTFCLQLSLSEFSKLLEAMLEVQSGLQELRDWDNENREAQLKRDRWTGTRGTIARDARLEFENLHIHSA